MDNDVSNAPGMTAGERRAAASLAAIFSLRMLGLFMILPVFFLYAEEFAGATPLLVGIALSAYGLTQAALQIPFGMLSDRLGRKRVIAAGLLLFALGSVVAAQADSIYMVIAGRAIQGAGAIASAIMALGADLTREEHRTKVMASIGMSIGAAFALALVLGPVLDGWFGLQGMFWLTAVLALLALAVLVWVVPTPAHSSIHRESEPVAALFRNVLLDTQLLRLDAGILILHCILMAGFVAIPLALRDVIGFDGQDHWQMYLPVLLVSVALMVPFIILAERHGHMKAVFLSAIGLIAMAELVMYALHANFLSLAFGLLMFFTAFNLLEATLPSMISKLAPAGSRGTAMGVYSSSQFLGVFLGGTLGGWIYGHFGLESVFLLCAGLALLWLGVAAGMQPPRPLSSHLLRVDVTGDAEARDLAGRLAQVEGVAEVVVVADEGVAYLKIDRRVIDPDVLTRYAAAEG